MGKIRTKVNEVFMENDYDCHINDVTRAFTNFGLDVDVERIDNIAKPPSFKLTLYRVEEWEVR